MTRVAFFHAAPAIALALAVLVPFLHKAFTIDDTLFLKQAQHALVDPLHPTAFEAVWSEAQVPIRVSRIMPSGPVMAWLLLPAVRAGGVEWLAHVVQFGMLGLALFATVALAIRIGLPPRWAAAAGLLLAATPAVLGMAGTVMPDVPAMALGVAGLERQMAWKQERRAHQAVGAALLLALAPLARAHLILLVGVGALLMLDELPGRAAVLRVPRALWAPLGAAPLLMGAVIVLTRDPAPGTRSLLGAIAGFATLTPLRYNVVAFSVHWVLAFPLALAWVALRPALLRDAKWVFLAAGGLFFPLTWSWKFGMAAIMGLGIVVLWDVISTAWKQRDVTQVALVAWLLVPLPVVCYLILPAKHLLASAPAVAILVARAMAAREGRWASAVLGVTMAVGLLVGNAILRADAAFADLGRRAAAEWIAPHVAAGERVWFAGHWGFQWYAEKAGARCLTRTAPHPAVGDLAVSSLRAMGAAIDLYPHRTRLARLADDTPGGRVMSNELDAGFFSNGTGNLPWAWGDVALDELTLWRLDQSAPTLPPEQH